MCGWYQFGDACANDVINQPKTQLALSVEGVTTSGIKACDTSAKHRCNEVCQEGLWDVLPHGTEAFFQISQLVRFGRMSPWRVAGQGALIDNAPFQPTHDRHFLGENGFHQWTGLTTLMIFPPEMTSMPPSLRLTMILLHYGVWAYTAGRQRRILVSYNQSCLDGVSSGTGRCSFIYQID